MTALPDFPDVELIVLENMTIWQADLEVGDQWRSGVDTPPNLQDVVPFARVQPAGGANDGVNDLPIFTVDSFAPDYSVAKRLAEKIRNRLMADYLLGTSTQGMIDRVECLTPHQELPWADENLRRVRTAYRAVCRRLPMSTVS